MDEIFFLCFPRIDAIAQGTNVYFLYFISFSIIDLHKVFTRLVSDIMIFVIERESGVPTI